VTNDPTLVWRVLAGVVVFAAFALYDWRKHPDNPTRVREYAFLFGVTGAAMVYGVLHDIVTYHLSPEYYIYGKGIYSARGGWNSDIAKLALQATWTAGLIGGAAMLMANNPGKRHAPIAYPRLLRLALIPLGASVAAEITVGMIAWLNADRLQVWYGNAFGFGVFDDRFALVMGMHWGAYGGGLLGLLVACYCVRREGRIVTPRED